MGSRNAGNKMVGIGDDLRRYIHLGISINQSLQLLKLEVGTAKCRPEFKGSINCKYQTYLRNKK
jgi:hypothetical protein